MPAADLALSPRVKHILVGGKAVKVRCLPSLCKRFSQIPLPISLLLSVDLSELFKPCQLN